MSVDKIAAAAAAEHAGHASTSASAKHPVDYHGVLLAAAAAGAIPWVSLWQILQLVARFGWPVISVIVPLFFQPNHGGYTIKELVAWAEQAIVAEASGLPLPSLPPPAAQSPSLMMPQ